MQHAYWLTFYLVLYWSLYFQLIFLGNKKSLADAVEKGVDLRDRILKLYHDNYYGGSMKLVVIGGGRFYIISPQLDCC